MSAAVKSKTSSAFAKASSGGKWLIFWVIIVALLSCLPLLALMIEATGNSADIWPHILANVLPQASIVTIVLLFGVAIVTISVGTVTAWLVSRYQFPLRNVLQWALVLPLAIPTYIAAYCWVEFFDYTGPIQGLLREMTGWTNSRDYWFPQIRSTGGAIFLMGMVLFPYVYLPARLSFSLQGHALLDAARLLGTGPVQLFWKVAIPVARPAIVVGTMLALMETLNDIGAVEHLGVRTLTFSIFDTWLNRSSLAGAAQMALLLLLLVSGLVFIERRMRAQRQFNERRVQHFANPLIQLRGLKCYLASIFCLMVIFFGFAIPFFQLLLFSLSRLDQLADYDLWRALGNSLFVASGAAAVCVLSGFLLVYSARRGSSKFLTIANRISSLGYAIPGTVLAIGVLVALTSIDNQVSKWMQLSFGWRSGLLLSGTSIVVIYACSVRFLTIASANIESGYSRIAPNLSAAARTLGRTERQALFEVEIPLMKRALTVAGILVFVETIKELSATILLRPFNFNTLSTFVYEKASRALFEDASIASLLIVVSGLIPVYLLTRMFISKHNG